MIQTNFLEGGRRVVGNSFAEEAHIDFMASIPMLLYFMVTS